MFMLCCLPNPDEMKMKRKSFDVIHSKCKNKPRYINSIRCQFVVTSLWDYIPLGFFGSERASGSAEGWHEGSHGKHICLTRYYVISQCVRLFKNRQQCNNTVC